MSCVVPSPSPGLFFLLLFDIHIVVSTALWLPISMTVGKE